MAAYTHRIAISNQRILSFDGESVTFSWRDYADGNQQKEMTLPAVEFLRRFATHIVPPRFTRIRYYGFLANCVRGANLERARELLGSRQALREIVRYAPLCPPSGHDAPRGSHRTSAAENVVRFLMIANVLWSVSVPGILVLSCVASVRGAGMHLQWNAVAFAREPRRSYAGGRCRVSALELSRRSVTRACHPPSPDRYNPHEWSRLRPTQLFPAS